MIKHIFLVWCCLGAWGAVAQVTDSVSTEKAIIQTLSQLSPEDMERVLAYSEFLLLKSKESDTERQTRLDVADQVLPTEETVAEIRDYSRYLLLLQYQQEEKDKQLEEGITSLSFEALEHDFGVLQAGEIKEHTFRFTNTGKHPLHIRKVRASCGCTVTDWPKEDIAPGATAELKVTYDSTGKKGKQLTIIRFMANTQPESTSLFLRSQVAE